MRKSIYILNLSLILMIFSCGQNSSEKNLIGKWYEVENEYQKWHFYPDSLVFIEDKVEWKGTQSTIEFDFPTFYWDSLGKLVDTINKVRIFYKLSDKKDSLFGTLKNNYGIHKFSLIKAENYIEYLNKKFGIEFKLPKDDTVEVINSDAIYGLKIFMEKRSDKIVGRTEISSNLNNLESDIKIFKDSIRPNELYQIKTHEKFLDRRFHLRVFADKSIPDSIITKYLKATLKLKKIDLEQHFSEELRMTIPDTLPIRIYRIFENKNANPRNLKAKKIKTIANNVYN